jgi:hypothetical protein
MSFFDNIMDVLKPVATAAAVITGNPIVAAVAAALKIIDKVEDVDDDSRTEMYATLAKGFGDLSAGLIVVLEDGKVTEAEHKRVIAQLEKIIEDLG